MGRAPGASVVRAHGATFLVVSAMAAIVATLFSLLPTIDDRQQAAEGSTIIDSEEGGTSVDGDRDSGSIDAEPSAPVGALTVGAVQPSSDGTVESPAMDSCTATRAQRQAIINEVIVDGRPEWLAVRSPEFDAEYREAVVSTMYCQILGRPADEEGLTFWASELGSGMGVYDLYLLLTASEEYQALRLLTDSGVLRALDLNEELDALAAQAVAAERAESGTTETSADGAGAAAMATTSTPRTTAPAPTTTTGAAAATTIAPEQARDLAIELDELAGRDGFRARVPVTSETFDAWVNQHGVQNLTDVTDSLAYGTRHVGNQRVHVAFVHLSETRGVSVSPGDNGRATVGTWAQEVGAHVAVNGNWYSPWDGPAVSGGVSYAGTDHNYTSLFGFTADGDAIIEHHREINDRVDPRIVEGVSGHPTLIHRGVPTTDFGTDPTFLNRNPRTAIGLDQSGDILILVTVDGRRSSAIGMTGAETVQLMIDVGATDAVMLDGGGSSTMWVAGLGVVNRPSGGLRAVGNQIAAFGD